MTRTHLSRFLISALFLVFLIPTALAATSDIPWCNNGGQCDRSYECRIPIGASGTNKAIWVFDLLSNDGSLNLTDYLEHYCGVSDASVDPNSIHAVFQDTSGASYLVPIDYYAVSADNYIIYISSTKGPTSASSSYFIYFANGTGKPAPSETFTLTNITYVTDFESPTGYYDENITNPWESIDGDQSTYATGNGAGSYGQIKYWGGIEFGLFDVLNRADLEFNVSLAAAADITYYVFNYSSGAYIAIDSVSGPFSGTHSLSICPGSACSLAADPNDFVDNEFIFAFSATSTVDAVKIHEVAIKHDYTHLNIDEVYYVYGWDSETQANIRLIVYSVPSKTGASKVLLVFMNYGHETAKNTQLSISNGTLSQTNLGDIKSYMGPGTSTAKSVTLTLSSTPTVYPVIELNTSFQNNGFAQHVFGLTTFSTTLDKYNNTELIVKDSSMYANESYNKTFKFVNPSAHDSGAGGVFLLYENISGKIYCNDSDIDSYVTSPYYNSEIGAYEFYPYYVFLQSGLTAGITCVYRAENLTYSITREQDTGQTTTAGGTAYSKINIRAPFGSTAIEKLSWTYAGSWTASPASASSTNVGASYYINLSKAGVIAAGAIDNIQLDSAKQNYIRINESYLYLSGDAVLRNTDSIAYTNVAYTYTDSEADFNYSGSNKTFSVNLSASGSQTVHPKFRVPLTVDVRKNQSASHAFNGEHNDYIKLSTAHSKHALINFAYAVDSVWGSYWFYKCKHDTFSACDVADPVDWEALSSNPTNNELRSQNDNMSNLFYVVSYDLGEAPPTIACNRTSDCGTSGYVGNYYCSEGNAARNYTTFTCVNPGQTNSYCVNFTTASIVDTCAGGEVCVAGQSACFIPSGNETNQTTNQTSNETNETIGTTITGQAVSDIATPIAIGAIIALAVVILFLILFYAIRKPA